MKKLDGLVVRELFGPWVFGVAMFTTLLIAATYLGRIADYIVQGVPPARIGEITLLLLPAILVKTFAMATLLAALLGFGRLSGDSEIVALRAAGASLWRILLPVVLFAAVAAGMTFFANEALVPSAAKRSTALVAELTKTLTNAKGQSLSQAIYEGGKIKAMITALDFSLAERQLRGVEITAYDDQQRPSTVLFANSMRYQGRNDWRIEGGATLFPLGSGAIINVDEAWPNAIPQIGQTPEELAAPKQKDPDFFSMGELKDQIERARVDKSLDEDAIRDREFWYWNKIALPLATLMFGALGGALGIRSARTGTATGFALAIGIIFGYFMVTNFMSVWAIGGLIPPWLASFTPSVLGGVATWVVVSRKNR